MSDDPILAAKEPPEIHDLAELLTVRRHSGDLVFAVAFLLVGVVLLSLLGEQTKYIDRMKLLRQPGFWPAVSLGGMVLFSALYAFQSWQQKQDSHANAGPEVRLWFKPMEYGVWFMAYVFVVPSLGYLLSTLAFCLGLAMRAGYRQKLVLAWAGIAAVGIVVLFKSFLGVKIPGGAIYEYLPDTARNFMILYF
jgi:hypothetical protein